MPQQTTIIISRNESIMTEAQQITVLKYTKAKLLQVARKLRRMHQGENHG